VTKVNEIVELTTGKFAKWGGISFIGNYETREEAKLALALTQARDKLNRLWGFLAGTVGSVCDYSAEALRDRMKHMVAIITDDKKSMEKYDEFGDLCHWEHEAQQAREGGEADEVVEHLCFDETMLASNLFDALKHTLEQVGVVLGRHEYMHTDDRPNGYVWSFGKRKATAEEIEEVFPDVRLLTPEEQLARKRIIEEHLMSCKECTGVLIPRLEGATTGGGFFLGGPLCDAGYELVDQKLEALRRERKVGEAA